MFTAYSLASFREIPNRSGFATRQWITTLRLGTSRVDIAKKTDRGRWQGVTADTAKKMLEASEGFATQAVKSEGKE